MRSGPMQHRINLQRLTRTADASGQPVETWATVATVWAQVKQLSATERAARLQTSAEETRVFRIRADRRYATVSPGGWRVLWRGRAYDLTGVVEVGRGEGWELTGTARVE
jgi:SPP1 family predicted phage head-tail adaptor